MVLYEIEVTEKALDWIAACIRKAEKYGEPIPSSIYNSLYNARKVYIRRERSNKAETAAKTSDNG